MLRTDADLSTAKGDGLCARKRNRERKGSSTTGWEKKRSQEKEGGEGRGGVIAKVNHGRSPRSRRENGPMILHPPRLQPPSPYPGDKCISGYEHAPPRPTNKIFSGQTGHKRRKIRQGKCLRVTPGPDQRATRLRRSNLQGKTGSFGL